MKSIIHGLASALKGETPVPFVGKQLALPWGRVSAQEQQMRTMGAVGTVFSIVNRTSTSTSKVEWCLYRKSRTDNPDDRVKVLRHAALDLWNKPNPFMARQEFVETFQQHEDLVGEAWWVIGTDPRAPTFPLTLWPVRPDRMMPIPDAERFISGYVYLSPDGQTIPLRVEQVIFLKLPNPMDPFRGMGPIQSILADLDANKYSAEWNRNFFINGAVPGGIVELPGSMSDTQFDEWNERWEEQHKGVANAFRVATLENGAKWVDVKYTNNDMQFVELRNVSREIIREAFGIPKFAIGIIDDINRATAEASTAWFASELIVPRLDRIKAALNDKLLPLFGDDTLEFDYENPVPEDEERKSIIVVNKANAAKTLKDAGWDEDDILATVGLPPMKFEEPPAPVAPPPPSEDVVEAMFRAMMNARLEGYLPKGSALSYRKSLTR